MEAEQPFEGWDQEMLVEDLQRELEHQRAQELELQQVLDLLVRQRELEDLLFAELDGHPPGAQGRARRDLAPDGAARCHLREYRFRVIEEEALDP